MRRWSVATLVLLAGVLGVERPAIAAPEPSRAALVEAGERYKRGIQLYEEGDYAASLVEFRRAYELAPAARVLFNIGRVARQLQNYVEALRAFERYVAEAPASVPRARVEEAQREIDELRRRVGWLAVQSDVAGAEVFLDGDSLGQTPVRGPVPVNSGRRQLSAKKAGYEPFSANLEVAGGEVRTVRLALVERAAPGPAAAPEAPPARPSGGASMKAALPWVGLATAGVLAAGAGVAGGVAYAQATDARDEAARAPVGGDFEDRRRRAQTWAVAADLLAGAAIVSAGVSVGLLLARPAGAPARRASSWRFGLGGPGVCFEARF